MSATIHMTASEFKATCLDVLDQIAEGKIEELVITKRGRPVATVIAPKPVATAAESLFGCLKGQVVIPDGFDLTQPASEELPSTATGELHQ